MAVRGGRTVLVSRQVAADGTLLSKAMSESAATVLQATRALSRFSSHDWVSNIDVPTAVVITTRDEHVPPRRQYKLAASIPGARIFEVDADHLACVRAVDRFVPALVGACEYVATAAGCQPSSR